MKVKGLRAWYADGSVHTAPPGHWAALPDDGVLAIVLYFDETTPAGLPLRRIMSGHDFYFKAPGPGGEIYGESHSQRITEPTADILRRYPGASVKYGKWTDDDTMRRVDKEAADSREL